jgi:hypothetical protein
MFSTQTTLSGKNRQQVDGSGIRYWSLGILALIGAFLLLALPIDLHAQIDRGSITGTVSDGTGAKIVGAKITLTDDDTGVAVNATSTSTGAYFIGGLDAGSYSLTTTVSGFKTYEARGIQIHVQQTDNLDIQLQVGATTENVQVTTSAALLQTEDATLGQTVNEDAISNLPLNGRNWASLAQIAAGVQTTSIAAGLSPNSSSGWFVVNGINEWQNDFRLDGIDNNEEVYGGGATGSNTSITPPPDAIQEFRLQTGNMSAEFGKGTAGVVNAVIKTGGNSLHGDLWEFFRNTVLDSNDYFNKQNKLPRPPYHQNQFGGTIGGPVFIPKLYDGRARKTYFFFDIQDTRQVNPSSYTSSVPTASEAASGYTNLSDLITYNNSASTKAQKDALGRSFLIGTVFDPATTRSVAGNSVDPISGLVNPSSSTVNVRDPFYAGSVNGITNFTGLAAQLNQIPKSRLDPNVVNLFSLYPAPTAAGIVNNYFRSASSYTNYHSYDIRIDQTLGAKDNLFGVYDRFVQNVTAVQRFEGYADGQTGTTLQSAPHYAVAAGYDHVFSSSLVNEFHFGYNHNIDNGGPLEGSTFGLPEQYGIQGIPQYAGNGGLPPISVGALTGLGVRNFEPTIRTIEVTEFMDNLTKTHGSHVFKGGYQLNYLHAPIIQPTYSRGGFNYSGQFTTIPNSGNTQTGVADALISPGPSTVGGTGGVGGVASYNGSNYTQVSYSRYYMGAYFQDDWKLTPTLTVNLGLRWDHTSPYKDVNGNQANFISGNNGQNGAGGTYYVPNRNCAKLPTVFKALLTTDGIQVACTSLDTGSSQYDNFAPRIGFAYHFVPRMVVRGGYGIAYGELGNIGFGGTLGQNYPFFFNISGTAPNTVTPLVLPNGQTATMENTFAVINLQDPNSLSSGTLLSLYGRQWNYQSPYTQTMNLTFQYALTHFDSIQAGYVGTLGRHLDVLGQANSPSKILPPGAVYSKNIPNPQFTQNAEYETTNAVSSYDGLQVTFDHQLSHGLAANANYTFSKCLSNQHTQAAALSWRAEWLPGFGPSADYSLCEWDATNVFHLSGSYQLPFGKGRQFLADANRATDLVVGGWDLNFIVTHQGGQPFTVGCATTTVSFFGCDANVVPGEGLYKGAHTQHQWLNPAAFATPPVATATVATIASLGGRPFQARNPSFNNLDASIFKNFSITEQFTLQFRAEAFNATNTPSFGNPGNLNYTSAANFSQITSERGTPRLYQLALKLFY